MVDGLNRRTEYTYDAFGHPLTVKRLAGTPDAVTTTLTYEPTYFQPATISDIRDVELVFKDGVGYDPAAPIAATEGTLGQWDFARVLRWPFNVILVMLGGLLLLLVSRILWRQTSHAGGRRVQPVPEVGRW